MEWLEPEMANVLAGGTGGSEGSGVLSKLGDLFKNKLFLQMLAASGADLIQGSGGKNILGAINQNISSQNYSQLLSHILGGSIPGADMKVSSDGIKLNLPNTETASKSDTTNSNTTGGLLGSLSPFASSPLNFSAKDLAGVDPQLINQALQLKLAGDELQQKKLSDIADMVYKQGLTQYNERMAAVAEAGVPIRESEAETNRMEAYAKWLDLATKDQRTELQKNFDAAEKAGFAGKIWDFKAYDETGNWRDYQKAKEGGYKGTFEQWLTKHETSRATRISLGEEIDKKSAFSKLQGPDFFRSSDWKKSIDTHMRLNSVQDSIDAEANRIIAEKKGTYDEALAIATRNETYRTVENTIITNGGKIVPGATVRDENGVVTWTVQWPDITDAKGNLIRKGERGTVSYGFK